MEASLSAVRWVLGMALSPVKDGLLEAWAASAGLGPNIEALKMELLYAQAMLDNAHGREVRSPALKELLLKLRQLAYNADDVLDELEYFRIQDELEGTHDTTDVDTAGCVRGFMLNARHTVKAVGSMLKVSSCSHDVSRGDDEHDGQGFLSGIRRCSCCKRETSSSPPSPTVNHGDRTCMPKVTTTVRNTAHAVGKLLPCCSSPSVVDDDALSQRRLLCGGWLSKEEHKSHAMVAAPKLKFDRVEISRKMNEIVEQLKPICSKVFSILNLELLGSNRTTPKHITLDRPQTTPVIDQKLFGRKEDKNSTIQRIIHGENELTVLPIVGPGGIGKTTFTQHIYEEVKSHFQVSIWICVSLNFNVSRLAKEAVNNIPEVAGEKKSSDQELIKQRLKCRRFLLVLDDLWACHEEEWNKLLAPFKNNGEKGNMIIVTTRMPDVAKIVKTVDFSIQMEGLDHEDFMDLFKACVFDDQHAWEKHPELQNIGEDIVKKLKGFPLAAKTVGRLLRNQLTSDHWTRVLESKEWELQTSDDDIMPALKLSFDYLPFHLQQCFSYCSLFPEDYEFVSEDLILLWMGLDIIHSQEHNKRPEDVGLSYLSDLVNHGFFKKNEKVDGSPCYIVHDLLHELAVMVSSYECLSINSTNIRSIQIPPLVRHLSIIVDYKDVEDRMAFEFYKKDLCELEKRLKVENLRTLMLFGEHHGSFAKTLADMFKETRALRAIFLSGKSYIMDDVLSNFSKLIHLRYIRIKSTYDRDMDICLANSLSRLYHLVAIDLRGWGGITGSTRNMSNLVKLRHFLLREYFWDPNLHSDISEVGKVKMLHELRRFEVGHEEKGFELSQLDPLTELRKVAICNLERVRTKEEAQRSKLLHKSHLHNLTLEWDKDKTYDTYVAEGVIENLKPHSNLKCLCIRGHKGANCPSWLGANISIKSLESLQLDNVSWNDLPPIGGLWLAHPQSEKNSMSSVTYQGFYGLKTLELANIDNLKRWVINEPHHQLPLLEDLRIVRCKELLELRFAHPTCQPEILPFPRLQKLTIAECPKLQSLPKVINEPHRQLPHLEDLSIVQCKELLELRFAHSTCQPEIPPFPRLQNLPIAECPKLQSVPPFPRLQNLTIAECPKLQSLPKVPRTSDPCWVNISNVGPFSVYRTSGNLGLGLTIEGKNDAPYRTFWDMLAFHNLSKLISLEITKYPPIPLDLLLMMRSLESLTVQTMNLPLILNEGQSLAGHRLPIKQISIYGCGVSGKQLTQLISHCWELSHLTINRCDNITGLGVMRQQQQEEAAEEEITTASASQGLLLLPPQLQELTIYTQQELILCSGSLDDGREAGAQGWLLGLCFLRHLELGSPMFLSSYSGFPPCFLFPSSLQVLQLSDLKAMETLVPVSNLVVLKKLEIYSCGGLRCEDIGTLIAYGQLTELSVMDTPNFFDRLETSLPHQQEHLSHSSKVLKMAVDVRTGFCAAPICHLLSSSVTSLLISGSDEDEPERYTKEQEEALLLLTSLEDLNFYDCHNLQCLPAGLHALSKLTSLSIALCEALASLPDVLPSSLKELTIASCPGIRSLPKDGLPSSLEILSLYSCDAILSLPAVGLPNSLQQLRILRCPAIRSLPKDDLPSSLRILDVHLSGSEELKRQCRKLKGTIPIIRVD